jgi:hypothetical protein
VPLAHLGHASPNTDRVIVVDDHGAPVAVCRVATLAGERALRPVKVLTA